MPSETSRRCVLAGLVSAFVGGIGAGCLGQGAPELRVRNFAETARILDVEVARADGETVHAAEYRLGPDERATTQEIFDYAGTYLVTVSASMVSSAENAADAETGEETTAGGEATTGEKTTSNEIDVDEPDGTLTRVTVREDGVSIGRIAP